MGRDRRIVLSNFRNLPMLSQLQLRGIDADWRTIEKAVPIEAAIGRQFVLGKHQKRAGNCVTKTR
jgi:hypothetical protein